MDNLDRRRFMIAAAGASCLSGVPLLASAEGPAAIVPPITRPPYHQWVQPAIRGTIAFRGRGIRRGNGFK